MQSFWEKLAAWFNDRVLQRVLRNSTYLVLSNLISVFLTIFITRRLGVYNYGVLGLITSYVTNVNKLFSFRMNEVVVHYVGETYVNQDHPKTGAMIKFAALVEAVTSLFAFIFMAATARLGAKIFLDEAVYREMMAWEPKEGYEATGPHDACFAIYTSGTTGKPKGVLHEYGKLEASVCCNRAFNPKARDICRFAAIFPLNFAAYCIKVFCRLYSGNSIYI